MKRVFLIFFMFPCIARSQLYINFESGTLSGWKMSRDSGWTASAVEPLCGNFSLRHSLDDSLNGEDRISIAYDSLVLTDSVPIIWQFALRHAYPPSASNNWAVFLLSDMDEAQMNPHGMLESVVLGVNFSGSDDLLKLWYTREGTTRVIVEANLNWQEEIGTGEALLRVRRESGGAWTLEYGTGPPGFGPDEAEWQQIGQGVDDALPDPGYFGIYYHFSSKQDRKFWFDELRVKGIFQKDTSAPVIAAVDLPDEHTLRVRFSENLDFRSALQPDRYLVLPEGWTADSVLPLNGNTLDVCFGHSFPAGEKLLLRIRDITDLKGNVAGILEAEFTWYRAGPGDVIFNEVMFDPFPEIDLPGYEYVELLNRSGFTLGTEGWLFRAGNREISLPDIKLDPGGILLLCYQGGGDLYPYADTVLEVLPVKTFLSNEGAILSLLDGDSVLIDWMEYTPAMHVNEYFSEGGWSLERIDPERTCFGEDNWTSSRSPSGGSPGRINPVQAANPDRTRPEILSVTATDTLHIVVEFSEAMDPGSVTGTGAWITGGLIGTPDSLRLLYPRNRLLTLTWTRGLQPGTEYSLETGAGLKDCSGNPLQRGRTYRFALPVKPMRSAIFISEILFNPWPFCSDFIELYNGAQKVFDLADLRLANRDPENGSIVSVTRPAAGNHLFYPGDYLAITTDPWELRQFYNVYDPACLVEAPDMPRMGDAAGSVLVLDAGLEVLEEMTYDREMHHPLLESDEGVSLERISFELGASNRSNWHSASSVEGWATPGRRNSQYHEAQVESEGFELSPEIFTPDNDGVDDILIIKFNFDKPGLRARILVVDPRGRLVNEIASRELLGTMGFFTWDGTDREGRRARSGLYLVIAEVSGTGERVRRYRRTCVLAKGR